MKLARLLVEEHYSNGYDKPPKLEASASFLGPFGSLSVKLSEQLTAKIVSLITEEAHRVAIDNAGDITRACNEAVTQSLALTHEAEATS